MAVAILGGLVTSTLLSLFVVPALYLRFGAAAAPGVSAEEDLLYRWAGLDPEQGEPASVGADGGAGLEAVSMDGEEMTSSDDPATGRSKQPGAASGVDHEQQGE
jgi:hypothetical protein